jgi:hypothetical protein
MFESYRTGFRGCTILKGTLHSSQTTLFPSTMRLIYFLLFTFTTCFGRIWPLSGVLLPKTVSLCGISHFLVLEKKTPDEDHLWPKYVVKVKRRRKYISRIVDGNNIIRVEYINATGCWNTILGNFTIPIYNYRIFKYLSYVKYSLHKLILM